RTFGLKGNAPPFELLAKAVREQLLARHRSQLVSIEAMWFGPSGLLHEELFGDKYFMDLRNEYGFLAKKYSLKMIEAHLWKFMRMRPVNFPTVRIAQLAALVFKSHVLFGKIIDCSNLKDLRMLFKVTASDYW